LLIDRGIVSEADLAAAERIQRDGDAGLALPVGEKIGKIIIRMGRASAMEVIRALCEQNRIDDYILVGNYIVSPGLVAQVPLEIAKRFSILPLVCCAAQGTEVFFGTDRAYSAAQTREVEELLGLKIEWVELREKNLGKVIERVYAQMAERGVRSVRIGEVLVREGLASHDEVEWALKIARRTNTRLGRVLIDEGLVSEIKFYEVLSRQKRVPLAKASEILARQEAPAVASRLSRTYAIFNEVVPFRLEDSKLSVAVSDPETDLSELRKIYSCRETLLHIVTLTDMVALLKAFYALEDDEAKSKGIEAPTDNGDVGLLDEVAAVESESSVTREELAKLGLQYERVFTNMLLEAIRRRTSDIHIENYENMVVVRLRIDGLLYDARTLRVDKDNVSGVVNVIKILSGMNIAERRIPQGGRFKKRTSSGDMYDFRVQAQPTLFGENVVIRLLHQSASFVPLAELGFPRVQLEKYIRVIENPSGLILITGPTGSGKTTTLYSTLDLLRKDTTNKIVTIEDPIEYSLPRIQQSQTLDIVGYNFAAATRAFLREDPDIALVGEIRDEETARETIKLSQTGHLVFSTLHTNTAASAAPRLFVLGVDPDLVASELLVVVAQRLARKICPDCRSVYEPKDEVLDEFYPSGVPSGVKFSRGAGCARCDGLGHVGRIALAEFWFIDHDSRMLITHRNDEDTIVQKTIGTTLWPMLADAFDKVHKGIVDISELPTVLPMASLGRIVPLVHERVLIDSPRTPAA
jgi:type IV pilus assembly protein PilB